MFLQTVAQQLPIHITIVQVPPVHRVPEWVKALITGGAGALFGLAIALIMEYVKPLIARWHSYRTVSQQLGEELMNNLRHIESCKRMLEDVIEADEIEQRIKMDMLKIRLQHLTDDRYQHYLSTQKEMVYKVDKYQMLRMFYRT